MKKILIVISFLFAGILVHSQVRVNADIHVGKRYEWRPPYQAGVQYYYYPDIDCYYYVPSGQFLYFQGGTWIYSRDLPYRYRSYDLERERRVIVNRPAPHNWDDHDNGYHRGWEHEHRHHHRY